MSDRFTIAQRFLDMVLPPSTTYCGSVVAPTKKWQDTAYTNTTALLHAAFDASDAGCNTYFGCSGFCQGWHNVNNKVVFRTQANACSQKALWLDIDVGKGGSPYNTPNDVLVALGVCLKETGLPVPTIVLSGNGVHVYWAFAETIEPIHWLKLATMLRGLCEKYHVVADHSRTMDTASVLRVPGTVNVSKDGSKILPVTLLHLQDRPYTVLDIAKCLIKETQGMVLTQPRPVTTTPTTPAGMNFVGMTTYTDSIPREPRRIVEGCRQIQLAGVGTYTQWFHMISVMRFCWRGNEMTHLISKTDMSRYNAEHTDKLFNQHTDTGPCRCDTFDKNDPGICHKCPHWGKITTPWQLGIPHVEKKAVEIPPTPIQAKPVAVQDTPVQIVPFSNGEFSVVPGKGVVWHKRIKTTDEMGESSYVARDVVILDVEVYVHGITIDNTNGELQRCYVVRKVAQGRPPEDILFPVAEALGPQKISAWLGNHGMLPIHPDFGKKVNDFMSTYLASLQNKIPETHIQGHFGWVNTTDRNTGTTHDGFIVGTTMYTEKGPQKVKLNERAGIVAESLITSGSLEQWRVIPDMYQQLNQPFGALMMLSSFAAPFMKYGMGTATNIAYNFWDIKGGKGKTTSLRASAGIWGNPIMMLQSKSDTPASRFQKFAVYQNLPLFIDEVTTMRTTDMADMIYDIVNGKEKSRSTQSGTGLTQSGTWATITMLTSNKSLYEMLRSYRVQSDATCMRVIEMQCDFRDYTGTDTQEYITQIIDAIDYNYGWAGPAFLNYCFERPDVFKKVGVFARNFANKYVQQSDERFWLYGLAIPLAVGYLTNSAGLTSYDMEWLTSYVLGTVLPNLRSAVRNAAPAGDALISDFLNEHLRCTLSVKGAEREEGQQDSGVFNGLDTYVIHAPTDKLLIRHEMDTNTYYVSSKGLTKWCADNGLSLNVMLEDLRSRNAWDGTGTQQRSLGKYVSAVDRHRVQCYKFTLPKGD